MRKKSVIFGSVLLLIGGVALVWALSQIQKEQEEIARYQLTYSTETDDYMKQYNEWLLLPADERPAFPLILDENGKTKTRAQLVREQQERLKANLDKLASGEMNVPPFADALYGENWPSEIEAYKKRKAVNGCVLKGSVICTSMGGLIYVWWLLLGAARAIAKSLADLKQRLADSKETPLDGEDEENETTDPEETSPSTETLTKEEQTAPQRNQRVKLPKVLPNSFDHWKPFKGDPEINAEVNQIKRISNEVERIGSLLSDQKSTRVDAVKAKPLSGRDSSKPIDNTLKQLSEEVSAIREYTSYQQDRLEKLQDGYDWNIIRTFCLRVIRCIDNLDNRMNLLKGKNSKATHLAEVRDELIFALESSGVEQFEPKINSDYRGQEKVAEAVKDRESNEDPELTGKIASVIRPGYQYFISEENVKVVRPAQVKLFA
jgi:molecular chaperone GrpE (heat shock protein)